MKSAACGPPSISKLEQKGDIIYYTKRQSGKKENKNKNARTIGLTK